MSRARDFADLAGSADAGGLTGRNLIINGAMQVAQRGTSQASITSTGYTTLDRFRCVVQYATFTKSQSTDVPSGQGFASSLKMACTTSASPAASNIIRVDQRIEGQNLQQLKKGTANAESLTLSFWVKSNKTGTYIVELSDEDNSRHICKSYTISSSGVWQKVELTYSGDTSGAFDNDNAVSLGVHFWLGSGSDYTGGTLATSWASLTAANRAVGQVDFADSNTNEWYITGIQLEVGETATPFEHRSYGDELRRCQRYLKLGGAGVYGIYNSAANIEISIPLNPNMRAAPTLSMAKTTVTISNKTNSNTATATSVSAVNISSSPSGVYFAQIGNCNVTSASAGHIAQFRTDEFLQLDAEL
jgi:hypothetical protein